MSTAVDAVKELSLLTDAELDDYLAKTHKLTVFRSEALPLENLSISLFRPGLCMPPSNEHFIGGADARDHALRNGCSLTLGDALNWQSQCRQPGMKIHSSWQDVWIVFPGTLLVDSRGKHYMPFLVPGDRYRLSFRKLEYKWNKIFHFPVPRV